MLAHHRDDFDREMYTQQSLRTGRLVEDMSLREGIIGNDERNNCNNQRNNYGMIKGIIT